MQSNGHTERMKERAGRERRQRQIVGACECGFNVNLFHLVTYAVPIDGTVLSFAHLLSGCLFVVGGFRTCFCFICFSL